MHKSQRIYLLTCFILLSSTLLIYENALAGNLKRIPIPREEHDPLYVDMSSIKKDGDIINFKYVIDVPIFGAAYAVKRFRSNQVEATIL